MDQGGVKLITKIINLTPHPLNFVGDDGNVVATVPPSGTVARVSMVKKDGGVIDFDGVSIPISHVSYGQVQDLPDPQPDTIYVVSAVVAQAVCNRDDVFVPGDLVRDENGTVIGCRGLNKTV